MNLVQPVMSQGQICPFSLGHLEGSILSLPFASGEDCFALAVDSIATNYLSSLVESLLAVRGPSFALWEPVSRHQRLNRRLGVQQTLLGADPDPELEWAS